MARGLGWCLAASVAPLARWDVSPGCWWQGPIADSQQTHRRTVPYIRAGHRLKRLVGTVHRRV